MSKAPNANQESLLPPAITGSNSHYGLKGRARHSVRAVFAASYRAFSEVSRRARSDAPYRLRRNKNCCIFGRHVALCLLTLLTCLNAPHSTAADSIPGLALGNLVWRDLNSNGLREAEESGIADVVVVLFREDANGFLSFVTSTMTDTAGQYRFSGLGPGVYVVQVDRFNFNTGRPLEGMASSPGTALADEDRDNDDNGIDSPAPLLDGISSSRITLAAGGEPDVPIDGDGPDGNQTLDFGFTPSTAPQLSLGNLVWRDLNSNGLRETGEPGIGDVVVVLFREDANGFLSFVTSTMTDTAGQYRFSGLALGAYVVQVDRFNFNTGRPLEGLVSSPGTALADEDRDNDDNGIDNPAPLLGGISSSRITLAAGTEPDVAVDGDGVDGNQTLDFGFSGSAPVLQRPSALADNYNSNEDVSLIVPAPGVLSNDNDPDGGVLRAILISGASNGSLSLNLDGSFQYLPFANFNGAESFTYKANDGVLDSDAVTVNIIIAPVNDPPTIHPLPALLLGPNAPLQTVSLSGIGSGAENEIQPLTITALSSDSALIPNPAVTYASPNTAGQISFTPTPNASGTALITVTVTDNGSAASGGQLATTVSFPVTVLAPPPNMPPFISFIPDQTIPANMPSPQIVFFVGDAETAPESLVVSAQSSNQALVPSANIVFGGFGANRTVTIAPAPDQSGTALITIGVTDNGGLSAVTSFVVTVTSSQTFEADVAPRPDGNGSVSITDWVQLGRFVAALSVVGSDREFQRADCAPRQNAQGDLTLGNGTISVIDWVQSGRYAAAFDPVTVAGGPATMAPAGGTAEGDPMGRAVRIGNVTGLAGATLTVPVELVSLGNENALGFSLSFDPARLTFLNASLGAPASDVILMHNANQAGIGKIGIALAKPPGQTFPSGTWALLNLTFTAGAFPGSTAVTFDDTIVLREVSDARAIPVPANYASGAITINPAVVNVPPSLSAGQTAVSVDEGGVAANQGVWSDPDGDNVTLTASIGSITKNAGTWSWQYSAPDGPSAASVVITADDGHGGFASASFALMVNNVAPTATIVSPISGLVQPVNTPVQFSGSLADPGALDTHSASWTFHTADAAPDTVPATVTGTSILDAIQFSVPGVYFITLQVTDKDGGIGTTTTINGQPAFIVIFDPNGGHVTGGGWIDSPPGALALNLAAEGKAIFGFNAKYSGKSPVLKGNLEFDLQKAGFNFKSTSLDWLVVREARAQFKGSGTINRKGDFSFILTVIDVDDNKNGGRSDRFRLQIWDKASGAVIYDNQPGASVVAELDQNADIAGGSIVIQK